MSEIDFTAFRHPVEAVPCPACKADAGRPCRRPSGHSASAYHAARLTKADQVFIAQHGEDAWIAPKPSGGFKIHATGRAAARSGSTEA